MRLRDILETSSAGSTSSGSIASVPAAKRKVPKNGKGGVPYTAPQLTNSDGTVKNALDIKTNIFGGAIKR
jgi:hypothetical protein